MGDHHTHDDPANTLLLLTAKITSAYAAKNQLTPSELTATIGSVYRSLNQIWASSVPVPEKKPVPAASPKKSVTPDYIVCLEDGMKQKLLKRHLLIVHDMTPDEYRARWGLPKDYPMVSPNYAATRSELAQKFGLGRRHRSVQHAAVLEPAGRGRSRPKKPGSSAAE